MADLVSDWGIYYDPDPKETIVDEDKLLLELYDEFGDLERIEEKNISKWLLRFKMKSD